MTLQLKELPIYGIWQTPLSREIAQLQVKGLAVVACQCWELSSQLSNQ